MYKLVALLRVKDGILFLDQWLKRMEALVDEIVVVDNGSTDGTLEILKTHPKVVDIAQTEGFDEGRDKILVYDLARKRKPDWCIWLDVDEIFEDRLTRSDLDKLMQSLYFTKYRFRRFHLHNDKDHFQAAWSKLLITAWADRIMWKEQSSGYFHSLKIHNGNVQGIKGYTRFSVYRLKHYGYLHSDWIRKKTLLYLSVDNNPVNQKLYKKHENQKVKTWRWREKFNINSQLQVFILNLLLFLILIPRAFFMKFKRIIYKNI
jgi:glycosyltransferase involved in cell wall biosynthesis